MDGQTDCCLTENESLFFEGTKNKLKYLQECKNVADNGYPNPIKLLANPEEVDDTALLLVVPRFTPNHRQILCRVMTSLQVSDDLRLVRPNYTLRSEIEAVRERSESEYRRLESLIAQRSAEMLEMHARAKSYVDERFERVWASISSIANANGVSMPTR
jgi:hypothetical protein